MKGKLILLVGALGAVPLQAAEPQAVDVRTAITSRAVALRGRVTSIREVALTPNAAKATIRIAVEQCLKGIPQCPKTVAIDYVAQSLDEHVFPLDFGVSEDVLLMLQRAPTARETYSFSSSAGVNCDFAFRGDKWPRLDEARAAMTWQSAYGGKPDHLTWSEVLAATKGANTAP